MNDHQEKPVRCPAWATHIITKPRGDGTLMVIGYTNGLARAVRLALASGGTYSEVCR